MQARLQKELAELQRSSISISSDEDEECVGVNEKNEEADSTSEKKH